MSGNNLVPRFNVASAAVALFLVFGLGAPTAAQANKDDLEFSIVRGGRLYDNWYKEIRKKPPEESHPSYPTDRGYARDPKNNWRCNECHGWDYKGKAGIYSKGPHYTGIKGIHGMISADTKRIVAVLKDETHAYGPLGLLTDDDFRDLANFVSLGQVDMDRYISGASAMVKHANARRKDFFEVVCSTCHGLDGQKIGLVPPLGKEARDAPWKSMHTILNGHPNSTMPALRTLGSRTAMDLLAYMQTLPKRPSLSSIARGGRLYDNWYREIGAKAPLESHPSYPSDELYAKTPKGNWRCRECHGWDYMGRTGVYSKGRHFTGIKGIHGMANAEIESIIAVLKNKTHLYAQLGLLKDGDFRDLANFVSLGQFDMDEYIDRASRKAKGDKTKSQDLYQTICANCHGLGGYDVIEMLPLGNIAGDNPWRTLHTILNGHSDKRMPALRVLRGQVIMDLLAFVQTLPRSR